MSEDEKIKIEPAFNDATRLWHDDKPYEAIQILENLYPDFPKQPAILGMLGAIYFSLKNWNTALVYYEKTVELSPKSELASIALFHCFWSQERFDEAIKEANRYTKLNGFSREYALIFEDLDNNDTFHK